MRTKKIPWLIAGCSIIICTVVLLRHLTSSSSPSVKEFISSQNGDLGVEHIIALTELSDEYDLVFYYTSDNRIAANIIVKEKTGQYIGLVMTTTRELNDVNHISASTRQSYLSENTLYWGIAQSSEWTIDHQDTHRVVADELVLEYYFHNKSLDEEILDLNFICNTN